MTKIQIIKTNPIWVAGVKSEMAAKKQRFSRYFSIISGTKEQTILKLKQMKGADIAVPPDKICENEGNLLNLFESIEERFKNEHYEFTSGGKVRFCSSEC